MARNNILIIIIVVFIVCAIIFRSILQEYSRVSTITITTTIWRTTEVYSILTITTTITTTSTSIATTIYTHTITATASGNDVTYSSRNPYGVKVVYLCSYLGCLKLYVFEGPLLYIGYKNRSSYDFLGIGAHGILFNSSTGCFWITMEDVSLPLKLITFNRTTNNTWRVERIYNLYPGQGLVEICTDDFFIEIDPRIEISIGIEYWIDK